MTPEAVDLARRLVACKQWRWIAGMAYPRWGLDVGEWICDRPVDASDAPEGAIPMLDDFATAAILLRMAIDECQLPEEVAGLLTPHKQDGQDLGAVAAAWLLLGWEG